MKSEFIGAYELAGRVLKTAQHVGEFVLGHLKGGAWGDTATNIQPPHVDVEHLRGDE